MTEDEWVKAAMLDDSVVVELLLGLNHSAKPKPDFPLDWSVRQRRSKPLTVRPKKAPTRDSPTTPLSWSAGTSVSCGGGTGSGGAAVDGGPEESSCPNPPPPTTSSSKASSKARSKLNDTKEKRTTKRSRRKKTLAELKEDEIVLLRERRLLKKELAMLHVNLEKQRATNENLKRMKLDLQSQPASERDVTFTSDLTSPAIQQNSACNAQLQQSHTTNNFSAEQEHATSLEIGFALPDLNLPLDMEGVHEVQCETS